MSRRDPEGKKVARASPSPAALMSSQACPPVSGRNPTPQAKMTQGTLRNSAKRKDKSDWMME